MTSHRVRAGALPAELYFVIGRLKTTLCQSGTTPKLLVCATQQDNFSMSNGGGDRTRTCTGFHLNGFLDRGSTNYAYSSKRAELTGVRKPFALNALKTAALPHLVLGSNVSTFFHPVLSGFPRWSIQLIRSIALSMVIHY